MSPPRSDTTLNKPCPGTRLKPGSDAPAPAPPKETWIEQASSFIGFLVYLLILKTFFLPLFIIPTGSMAETLYGAHAVHTCPNCGFEYAIGWQTPVNWPTKDVIPGTPFHPHSVQCPNCRWQQHFDFRTWAVRPSPLVQSGLREKEILSTPLSSVAGDRIFVHGWLFDPPWSSWSGLGPARWDVVVFRVPTDNDTNYIKRLIGLPGEKLEIINGDVFINDRLQPKSPDAQRCLWVPYYDQDFRPTEPSPRARYHPRWVVLGDGGAWNGVDSRVFRFDGPHDARGELQFCTDPNDPAIPGWVQDFYSYNEPRPDLQPHTVTDTRLSALVELTPSNDGYLEFSTTKGAQRFYVRWGADGSLQLQHGSKTGSPANTDSPRETWDQCHIPLTAKPVRLALSHLDGIVTVEVNERAVLTSKSSPYTITPDDARQFAAVQDRPELRIAAERVQATLRHVLIERDVYYTSDVPGGFGVQGRPIHLGPRDYFMAGDNSPNSLDARYAFSRDPGQPIVGPYLTQRPDYQVATVPADQLIGRAFFVYWPGFLPLTPRGPNILPDFGRARWIH